MMDTKTLAREIKKRNPAMTLHEVGAICGVSKQRIHQALLPEISGAPDHSSEATSVQATIRRRGRIWEGCRPAFEDGSYNDTVIARLLREGVIIPASDPNGGYVLPSIQGEE